MAPLVVPNIMEFVTSPRYLNRALYPRQATLLKIITGSVDLLTDYDRGVIAEWETGFALVSGDGATCFTGSRGLAPGTVKRMTDLHERGRWWFSEVVLVLGRRAGKGYLTQLINAYLLWRILAEHDPQAAFRMDPTKQLSILMMAADEHQAATNTFADLSGLIGAAECFRPFLVKRTKSTLRLRTPREFENDAESDGSILVEARPSTPSSGRGAAALAFSFDEMAHAGSDGLQNGADEIYRAATPAVAQFAQALIWLASSPASQLGAFYEAHCRALAATPEGDLLDPSMLTVQLPSWESYLDWELTADGLVMWPGGPDFTVLDRAIISEDSEEVQRTRRANPDTFAVEYLAQWRSSMTAYLDQRLVRDAFGEYHGQSLTRADHGDPNIDYYMHCDPSSVDANFGIAIGHREGDARTGHIVFDYLHAFEPRQFKDHHIDYKSVGEHLCVLLERFRPVHVTFDQYNSDPLIQTLNEWVRSQHIAQRTTVSKRPATASNNWEDAERFKALLGERRIHAHPHALAQNELTFLQYNGNRVDHPTTGQVVTKDVADAMFVVVAHLMDPTHDAIQRLSSARMAATSPFGSSAGFGDPRRNSVPSGQPRNSRSRPSHNPARGRWR